MGTTQKIAIGAGFLAAFSLGLYWGNKDKNEPTTIEEKQGMVENKSLEGVIVAASKSEKPVRFYDGCIVFGDFDESKTTIYSKGSLFNPKEPSLMINTNDAKTVDKEALAKIVGEKKINIFVNDPYQSVFMGATIETKKDNTQNVDQQKQNTQEAKTPKESTKPSEEKQPEKQSQEEQEKFKRYVSELVKRVNENPTRVVFTLQNGISNAIHETYTHNVYQPVCQTLDEIKNTFPLAYVDKNGDTNPDFKIVNKEEQELTPREKQEFELQKNFLFCSQIKGKFAHGKISADDDKNYFKSEANGQGFGKSLLIKTLTEDNELPSNPNAEFDYYQLAMIPSQGVFHIYFFKDGSPKPVYVPFNTPEKAGEYLEKTTKLSLKIEQAMPYDTPEKGGNGNSIIEEIEMKKFNEESSKETNK